MSLTQIRCILRASQEKSFSTVIQPTGEGSLFPELARAAPE